MVMVAVLDVTTEVYLTSGGDTQPLGLLQIVLGVTYNII